MQEPAERVSESAHKSYCWESVTGESEWGTVSERVGRVVEPTWWWWWNQTVKECTDGSLHIWSEFLYTEEYMPCC